MKVRVDSEYGTLRHVLMASVSNFRLHEPINAVQHCFYSTVPPKLEELIREQAEFAKMLGQNGVQIHWAPSQPESTNQLNVRDIVTVIGDVLVVGAMKEPLRKSESMAIEPLISDIEGQVLRVDSGILEGGDVILGGQYLYIGLSERTNEAGLDWLRRRFSDEFEIVPIRLVTPFLHLDVVFNLLGGNRALLYPDAIEKRSLSNLRERYETIEVTEQEQFELATNVLSISPNKIVSQLRHRRVNGLLDERGFEVIPLNYTDITKIGGAFRCGTCPLVRDPGE